MWSMLETIKSWFKPKQSEAISKNIVYTVDYPLEEGRQDAADVVWEAQVCQAISFVDAFIQDCRLKGYSVEEYRTEEEQWWEPALPKSFAGIDDIKSRVGESESGDRRLLRVKKDAMSYEITFIAISHEIIDPIIPWVGNEIKRADLLVIQAPYADRLFVIEDAHNDLRRKYIQLTNCVFKTSISYEKIVWVMNQYYEHDMKEDGEDGEDRVLPAQIRDNLGALQNGQNIKVKYILKAGGEHHYAYDYILDWKPQGFLDVILDNRVI